MAKTTKHQIASAALAIAIVGGGGVVYAGNAPEKENNIPKTDVTSLPMSERS